MARFLLPLLSLASLPLLTAAHSIHNRAALTPAHSVHNRALGPAHNHAHKTRSWREAHPRLAALDKRDGPTVTVCPPTTPPAGFSSITSKYPKPSGIATIVSGDTTAQSLYNSILAYPAYKDALAFTPQGSNEGDFSNVTYDKTDPHCWWTYSTCHTPKQTYLGQDTYMCPEADTWGLTFDDGPFCDNEDFYDFLSRRSLKATLFYIGIDIYQNPTQAQRGIINGHEICVHTWSHHYMTSLTNTEVFAELYYTKMLIKDVLGVTATCWRPPFGDVDDRVRTWAQALGMRTIIWNHDTDDWMIYQGATPDQIEQNYRYIYGNASDTSGSIILTHELNADTIGMFMGQWDSGAIQKAYKNIVPVGSCMNITHPYLEDVTFPTFSEFVAGNVNATPPQNPTVSDVGISIVTSYPSSTAGSGVSASATSSGNNPAGTSVKDGSGTNAAGRTVTGLSSLALAVGVALLPFI